MNKTMSDVFILGAGFSKAISSEMPTLDELSREVKKSLHRKNVAVPSEFDDLGNNIESWMTFLSQRQPWLKEYDNDYNRSLASRIREQIGEIINDCTLKAARFDIPAWLSTLIKSWHDNQATIITLNYDTLIERASRELQVTEDIKRVLAMQMYPPYFSNVASRPGNAQWGEENIDTFSYFKLHGSLNWYYSGRDNFYGEPIFFSDVPPLGSDFSEEENKLRSKSKDKEILLIPPVYEKTTFFNNESVRSLWREAGLAIAKATRVFVIGYSLPISDLGMRFFLTGNQPQPSTDIYIIDIDPEVKRRFEELLPKLSIKRTFVCEQNAVEKFAQQYTKMNDINTY